LLETAYPLLCQRPATAGRETWEQPSKELKETTTHTVLQQDFKKNKDPLQLFGVLLRITQPKPHLTERCVSSTKPEIDTTE